MRPETHSDLEEGCRFIEWDSEFFGRRIARIDPAYIAVVGMAAAEAWCADHQIECAYLLADAVDQSTCDAAQAHGFRLVDVRVTLECVPLAPRTRSHGPVVRLARADDVERLEAIARASHRDTRFYVDGHFDPLRCDQLYELWIAKSCRGWADSVFVVEVDGCPAGYLTCHLRDGAGQIGLVAVSEASRGRGAGSALVDAARRWFADHGAAGMSVVTHGRNAAALRLYQRAGMTVTSIQLWFHKWL
jgi:dTDP-4-amino-4,6-dideoxy-D-galactose acyltransferase